MISPPTSPLKSRLPGARCVEQRHQPPSVPRNTARARSSRSSSSAVGPSKRTSPFSRKIARSAIASATLSDCSTMTIVCPRALSSLDDLEQPLHDERREPERELVDQQHLGLVDQHARRARASAAGRPTGCDAELLAALGELGEQLEHVGDALRRPRRRRRAFEPRAHRQVLVDGEAREHALAAGQLHDRRASPAARATT